MYHQLLNSLYPLGLAVAHFLRQCLQHFLRQIYATINNKKTVCVLNAFLKGKYHHSILVSKKALPEKSPCSRKEAFELQSHFHQTSPSETHFTCAVAFAQNKSISDMLWGLTPVVSLHLSPMKWQEIVSDLFRASAAHFRGRILQWIPIKVAWTVIASPVQVHQLPKSCWKGLQTVVSQPKCAQIP